MHKTFFAGLLLSLLLAVACTGTPRVDDAQQTTPPAIEQESDGSPATPQELKALGYQASADQSAAESRRERANLAGMAAAAPAAESMRLPPGCCFQIPDENREQYAHVESNPLQRVAEAPVSTFSVDVDTGSYANVRRFLKVGQLPPADAVRVEELINYFDYAYAAPRSTNTPFGIHTEVAPTPWNAKTLLLRIGIQGWKPQTTARASNLVFLLDVSGSMAEPNKLPLVKSSLKLLTRQLGTQDRVSLVVYAGSSGVVLEPTPGNDAAKIEAALDRLQAGGSTNGGEGIHAAYAMARQGFIRNGNNRVILATDGDFNVGVTRFEDLLDLVKEQRKSGVALTTLGFGAGNYNDQLMEQLADAGDGNHAYIDSLSEAQKVLVDQRDATLQTIARDVKIQVEFNPALVAEYRLIGYENRMLRREDFANDKIDAGDIGAGHTVTALYEVALTGGGGERVEPLRYQAGKPAVGTSTELAHVRLRYKKPDEGMDASSHLIERVLRTADIVRGQPSESWRLAAAVSAFGQLLRKGPYTEHFGYADVERLARDARGEDRYGYAGEFLQLVKLADGLSVVAHTGERGD
ncbi:MAG: VWA domain-containing protein [Sinimarinibacterium sp.]|jgi:Ca-activated chloride channel family protein